MTESTAKKARRGIYLLPNLFTTTAIFAGFYSILSAIDGEYLLAAFAIFFAMALDAMDGRVARMTHTQTQFGAQYDSLADLIAFGMAPALAGYVWLLHDLGKFGWAIAFLYLASAALRLARFNTQIEVPDKRFFKGLPSTACAGFIASYIALINMLSIQSPYSVYVLALFMIGAGASMVSSIPYYSFKEFRWREKVPFIALWIIVIGFSGLIIDPPIVAFICFLSYVLSGPLYWCWVRYKKP